MPAAVATIPCQSSYPPWLMHLVHPTETKKSYQKSKPDDDTATTTQEHSEFKQQQNNNDQPLTTYSHTVDIKQHKTQKPHPPQRQRTQKEQDDHDKDLIIKFFRRLFAEFLGTTIFVFLVAGVALEFNLTQQNFNTTSDNLIRTPAGLDQTGAGYASGLSLAFLIFAMGGISGAHFNPAVTWAFTLRGLFPVIWLPFYVLAQFAGSILAGGFLQAFYWNNAGLGTTAVNLHYQYITGFAWEVLLTFIFINVVLAMATKGGNVGAQAAIADGFAFATVVMIGLSYDGMSVNPFRSLGPGIINGKREDLWVMVAGPFLGATCSVGAIWLLNGPLKPDDYDAAQGSGGPDTDSEEDELGEKKQ